jgi:hypothetical protein
VVEPEGEAPWTMVGVEEFERDLATLTPNALRIKYRKEAASHRNMKARCATGAFELAADWGTFAAFLRSMGPVSSSDATLDRIDPAVNRYGPGLVRWATKKEQTSNRHNAIRVSFRGEEMSLADFATRIGRPYSTVYSAFTRGETPERIAASKEGSSSATPEGWRHPNPSEEAGVLRNFAIWRRKLNRRSKKYDHVDIYFYLRVFKAYMAGRRYFDPRLVALDPEDEAEFFARPEYRRWRELADWLAYTRRVIRARDPAMAEELTPRHPEAWSYLSTLVDRAIQPDPPDFSSRN